MEKTMKKFLKTILLITTLLVITIASINFYMITQSNNFIYKTIDELPEKQTVIILGAYVHDDRLSKVLEDRVVAGADVYTAGKTMKILLSGDHGQLDYDEVNSMRKYVMKNYINIPPQDIFMDHAGFDTYDSMFRAKEIFKIENAIIITQNFHINRAVFIANKLGINAVGLSVNESKYPKIVLLKWHLRESLSRVKAFGDILFHSQPKYLGNTIPITGNGRLSWDEFE